MSRSRGTNNPGAGVPDDSEDLEAEALNLEGAIQGAPNEDVAESLADFASDEVVEEAEELENEEEYAERIAATKAPRPGNRFLNALRRLYRGQTSFDFVGRRRWWFTLSAAVIIAGMAALGLRGLNLGIEFKGGTAWVVRDTTGISQSAATTAVEAAGLSQPTVEILNGVNGRTLEVQYDLNHLSPGQQLTQTTKVSEALAKVTNSDASEVSIESVGPTWGGQITNRAIEALIAFFVLVAIYISFRFEPKMAIAAFVALVHDLLVTVGVYSLFGFQVTPDTVIAVLTILGYSLYDTVVVFDRVRDNSKGLGATGRMTYTEMVNLSMNQTLARSINTSLVAILPVLAVLLVGADLLGAVTLQNYGLALFVGLMSGAYSSIFIASPVLAMLKEREPRYATIRHRLESRGERFGLLTPSAAALLVGAGAGGGSVRTGGGQVRSGRAGALRPGGASQTGKRANAAGKGSNRPGGGSGGAAGPGSASSGTGAGTGAGAGGTAAKPRPGGGTGGAARPSSSSAQRPVARPRKGGSGKGGKGKKRR